MSNRNGRMLQVTATSAGQARWQTLRQSPRGVGLGLLIVVIFCLFVQRLWYLQFVRGDYYRERASVQSTRSVTLPAARGIIYARDGTPLVRNVPSFKVTVTPGDLPDDEDEMASVLIRLAVLLDIPYTSASAQTGGEEPEPGLRERVEAVMYTAPYRPLVVKRGVERDTALLVGQEGLLMPGVSVEVDSLREYPLGPLVSQIVGYRAPIPAGRQEEYAARGYDASTDRNGAQGVEAVYEEDLRGQKGRQIVEEDVLGRRIRVVEEQASSVPGGNVVLTLDLDLQRVAEEALREGLERAGSPRGVVLVMNPQTGEILAMVSLPTYDNNAFEKGISASEWQALQENDHRPMINHAISDQLPPGSVFKVVVATAALQEGVLTEETTLDCPGTMVVPNKYYPNDRGQAQSFPCWNLRGHGSLNVVWGLAHSCDIFFYKVAGGFEEDEFEGLGIDRLAHYSRLFGFGARTGVELTTEISGTVPTATWKRRTVGENWSTGDTYILGIGQGYLLVTPLQMLNAVNVVANGGTLYRPQIVHHVTDGEGNVIEPFAPEVIRTLAITPANWTLVQQGMETAVVQGTATRAQVEGVRVAGKTGTAQFCDDLMCGTIGRYDQPEHAWFTAFAPVGQPEVSVIAFLYNGGEGSIYAIPVVREVLEYYFARGGVP